MVTGRHGRRSSEYWVILRYYWPRLLVTCMAWLANDFAFYGGREWSREAW